MQALILVPAGRYETLSFKFKIKRNVASMANTKSITDTTERKKVKRTARKKAAPKAPRTYARGSAKRKVKKLVRGQSKR